MNQTNCVTEKIPRACITETTPRVESLIRNDLLCNNSKHAQDFYIHLNSSSHCGFEKYDNGFVPIPSKFIHRNFRQLEGTDEIEELSAREILFVTAYDKKGGKCREFKIPARIKLRLLTAFLKDIRYETALVKKIIKKAVRYNYDKKLYDQNRNLRSKLVRDSMKLIRGKINQRAVKESIYRRGKFLENQIEDAYLSTLPRGKLISSTDYDSGVILRRPFTSDTDDEFIEYTPNYLLTDTGRIAERGGFQNMSRHAKQAALTGIDGVENGDLRSSQICGLYQLTEEMGIPNKILETYLDDKFAKFKWAEKVGFIDGAGGFNTGLWKKCLMSTVFLGSLSKGNKRKKKSVGSIYKFIQAEYFGNFDIIDTLFENFEAEVQPFLYVINDWYAKLPAYLDKHSRNTPYGRFFTNACGLKLNLDSEDTRKPSSVCAFILQGMEASMIHHLVLLGEEYGYRTLSHEHDGIVTIGTVPDEAIQLAKSRSGYSAHLI